jgi:uncharacterized membrane-anchored protein YjiN (DUF445 family)
LKRFLLYLKANLVLGIIFIIYIITRIVFISPDKTFAEKFIISILEASLAGGIADWFAVNALFRKPLGFGWHTAIIPKNREKLIKAISDIVNEELFDHDTILQLVNRTDIINQRFRNSNSFYSLAKNIREWVKGKFKSGHLEKYLKNKVEGRQPEKWISEIFQRLSVFILTKKAEDKVQSFIEKMTNTEKHNLERTFFSFLLKNGVSDVSQTTKIICRKLSETFIELTDIKHPLTRNIVKKLSYILTDDTKKSLLKNSIMVILEDVEMDDNNSFDVEIAKAVSKLSETFMIGNNTIVHLKKVFINFLKTEHYLIGEIATETLRSFDDGKIVRTIEERVAPDLQWIRINGCLIGGSAGAVLFLISEYLLDPLIRLL